METKNPMPNAMQSNSSNNGQNPPDPGKCASALSAMLSSTCFFGFCLYLILKIICKIYFDVRFCACGNENRLALETSWHNHAYRFMCYSIASKVSALPDRKHSGLC